MTETRTTDPEVTTINSDLARRVQEETGQNVYLCYQCVKCSSGCPVAEFFDWQPNQVMRAVQLGQEDIALHAQTPWLCACCQACTTRCPQGLDVAAIMEFLAREARAQGIEPPVPAVEIFSQAFMREVRLWGRAYELGLMAEMKLRTGDITGDLDLGMKLVQHQKLRLLPTPSRPPRKVKPVEDAASAIAYYPGCSLHSTSPEFNTSAKAVCESLGMNLIEPQGWVCCGSSAAHRADPEAAVRLPLENLSLVERSGFGEMTMPCVACFSRHKIAQHHLRDGDVEAADLEAYPYEGSVRVTSLIESILAHVGPEEVADQVTRPLAGLRVVCYYGCLLTRPPAMTEAAHPENPTEMDHLMAALGAEVIDWSYKTTCCGATHSLTRPDIVLTLSGRLIEKARESGADAIAVACPLCHTNLDGRQFQMKLEEPLPVLYFTQLMAVALGLPEKKAALDKNLVDPRLLLRGKGLI